MAKKYFTTLEVSKIMKNTDTGKPITQSRVRAMINCKKNPLPAVLCNCGCTFLIKAENVKEIRKYDIHRKWGRPINE